MFGSFYSRLKAASSAPSAADHISQLIEAGQCRTALDIGCGSSLLWQKFKPGLRTVGIDADLSSVEKARAANAHDQCVHANILELRVEDLLEIAGVGRFDLVALIDVIEHVPKRRGFELLEKCEQLAAQCVIVQTPNGFLAQGPEHGNEFQRHLSGWFVHDFEGLGYTVRGATGPRFLHGYAGACRIKAPGMRWWHRLLSGALRIERNPTRAFSLVAWKDVRGVPARL